jgi:hypothetical protein
VEAACFFHLFLWAEAVMIEVALRVVAALILVVLAVEILEEAEPVGIFK